MSVKPSTRPVVTTISSTDVFNLVANMTTVPASKRITWDTLQALVHAARTGTDGGTANARTLTVTPAITALVLGMRFTIKSSIANTGATTLAVSGLSAVAIKKNVSDALGSGDIPSGGMYEVIFDGTNFQLMT